MTSAIASPFLKVGAVLELVALSRSQIYKMMESGAFPAQVQLSGRAVAWRRADIEKWIADRQPVKRSTLLQMQAKRARDIAFAEERWKRI